MKKHIAVLVLAAAFLIVIPLFTVKTGIMNSNKTDFNSNNENKSNYLTELLAYEFREEYSAETLKAIGIILNSNYKSGEKPKRMTKEDFIKKHKNGERYYSLLENTAKEIKNKTIIYKGKSAAIPYSYITSGVCESDYPYLRDTANPWDLINSEYTFDAKPGVSLNGINKLCEKGLSCEQALNRYFKNRI